MKDWLAYEVLKNNSHVQDHVAVEIPVQLLLNKEKLTISMCSPSKLESWALGLLFTEGYITNRDDIIAVQVSSNKTTLEVAVETKSIQKRSNSMSLLSVTACGICGKTSFDAISGKVLSSYNQSFNSSQLIEKLTLEQPVFNQTGAVHAAGIFNQELNMLTSAEDVGRHNAVDKCIGDLFQLNQLSQGRILVVTSRVSYEIVAKAFKANLAVIVAVSAPTSLAIDICKELGIHLFGFVRGERVTQYC
ncbi:MAG: formate dehydrogenase accessory sulfurtransferase FdhD [Bacteroidetes bacterium]|nr:formate dehydrogenase accessory sulfurtransferase FdhD [Bacteroidota bacterium]